MTTIVSLVGGFILVAATTVGVVHASSDTAQRVPAGTSTSKVVLYGKR